MVVRKELRAEAAKTEAVKPVDPLAETKVRGEDGAPLLVHHGTEQGGFEKFKTPAFFTAEKAEAEAYTNITDTDGDRTVSYAPADSVELPKKFDLKKSMGVAVLSDYDGPPNTLAFNGNDGRIFYWDGKENAVGDKNFVIISDAKVDFNTGEVVRVKTEDTDALKPRELKREVRSAYLNIKNPIHLPWDEANLLGKRLGADDAEVQAKVAAWKEQGYDGIETESDDGAFFQGRKIRQFIPFDPEQIIEVKDSPVDPATKQALMESSQEPFSADQETASRELSSMKALSEARAQIGQQAEAPLADMPPELAEKLSVMERAAAKEAEALLLAPQIEEMKRDAKAELAQRTTQAEVEVAGEPLYEAQDSLRRAIGIGNDTFTEATVRNSAEKFMDGSISDDHRFLFEAAAENFGFTSGEELAQSIIGAPTREQAVKALAESRMTRELRQTPQMRAEALKALHTEKSTELLATKAEIMVGLARRTARDKDFAAGIQDRARETAREARMIAEKMIGQMPVTQAGSFRTYYTAERDAAVRAAKAAKKGDYEEASKAMYQQVAAHAMASEALRVRGQIEATTRSLLKLQRAKKKTYADQDQFVQAASILERFGFKHGEYDPTQKTEALADWVGRMEEYDLGVAIPDWIVNETNSKSWKSLTPDELSDVRNSVKNIKMIDGAIKKTLAIERGAEIEHLAGKMHEAKEASGLGGKSRGAGTAESDWDGVVKGKDFVRQGLITKESLLFRMDGGKQGVWNETLFEPLMRAEDRLGEASADINARYEKAHDKYTEKERREMDTKGIFIPEFKDTLTKENLIRLWMHQGTEGNKAKVLSVPRNGVQWTQEMVDAVLKKHITKRDADLGQARLDILDSMRPDILAFNKRVSGFEPKMVKAIPIRTEHGEYRGGYSPLTHDPRVTGHDVTEYAADQKLGSHRAGQAMTDRGYTKAREANAKYAVSLDSNDILRHMDDVLRDIHLREWVIDANRLLANPSVAHDLADSFGKPQYDNMREWVKRVAGNQADPARTFVESLSAEARRRSTLFLLAGKVSSMLRQLDFTVAAGVDPKNYGMKKIAASISDTYGSMLRGESKFSDLTKFVEENSAYMRQRQPGYDRDLMDALRAKLGKNTKLIKMANRGFGIMDRVVTHSIWKGAYKVGLDLNSGNHDKAVAYADRTIRKSNPPGRLSAMSDLLSTSELGKLLTMFGGQSERQLNLMYEAKGKVKSADDLSNLAGTAMAVVVIPAIMGNLIQQGLPTTDDKKKKWAKNLVMEPFQGVPLFKTGLEVALDSGLGLKGRASMSAAGGIFDAYQEMTSKAVSKKQSTQNKLEAATKMLGYTGVPVPGHFMQPIPSQYLSWFWNAVDIANGAMEPRPSDLLRRRPSKERSGRTY